VSHGDRRHEKWQTVNTDDRKACGASPPGADAAHATCPHVDRLIAQHPAWGSAPASTNTSCGRRHEPEENQ
jgi:hypothetical protein